MKLETTQTVTRTEDASKAAPHRLLQYAAEHPETSGEIADVLEARLQAYKTTENPSETVKYSVQQFSGFAAIARVCANAFKVAPEAFSDSQ